jgi:hypothetical protein
MVKNLRCLGYRPKRQSLPLSGRPLTDGAFTIGRFGPAKGSCQKQTRRQRPVRIRPKAKFQRMIPKSGNRFSEKIMRKQNVIEVQRFNLS